MLKKILLGVLIVLLSGCTTYRPLKAPCAYCNRSMCGPVVPLQQNLCPGS